MSLASLRSRLDAGGADGRGSPTLTLWVALTGLFATTFPVTVLGLAVPEMAKSLHTDERTLTWAVTLPIVCSALALPVLGKMGDLYGHRRVFLTGFALATVTTALTATAWSAGTLIAWRTLTAVTGAATQPSSLALINSSYPPERRARAMGWWAMVAAGAPVIGLIIGGPVIDQIGWQMLFVLQAALMVVPVIAAKIVLRETPRKHARFDFLGAAALSIGVGALMLAVSEIPKWGVTDPAILICLVVAPLAVLAFVHIERRVAAPLLPLEFFGRRDFCASVLASFFSQAAYMGAFWIASLMMINMFGYTPTGAVPILAIRPAIFAMASPLGGLVATRFGNRFSATVGCLVLGVGLSGLALGAGKESLAIVVGVGFVFQGLGFGLLRPAISTAIANSVDQEDLGVAGASERLMAQIGTALGITLLVSVYDGQIDQLSAAYLVGVAFAFGGLVFSALMLGTRRQRSGSLAEVALGETAREETLGAVPVEPSGASLPA
jgi:MFS family permease